MKVLLSREALDRLIGGETEIEVGLRRQVVERFAKERLKEFINNETLKRLHEAWKDEWKDLIFSTMQDWLRSVQGGTGGLRHVVHDLVTKLIGVATQDFVIKMKGDILAIQEKLIAESEERARRYETKLVGLTNDKVISLVGTMEKMIDAKMSAAFEQRVTAEVNRRLNLAAKIGAQDDSEPRRQIDV